jgi:type II restriction enzyme
MKVLALYRTKYELSDEGEVFRFLLSSLTESITYWDYFVNWAKVRGNTKDLEIDLVLLNYLIGKEDVEAEFRYLLSRHPSVIRLLPILLASREKNFRILTSYTGGELKYETFSFVSKSYLSTEDIERLCQFARETGLLKIFKDKIIQSVPDYVTGIEVGLDSNGRKNRGGTAMEKILETFVALTCEKYDLEYLVNASSHRVKEAWGMTLDVDKSDRRFDFVIRRGDRLFLLETNYYGGGGSKLKATAGEYRSLFDFAASHGYQFVWVTDGPGWKSARLPLSEAFRELDHILNLKMVLDGALDEVLSHGY